MSERNFTNAQLEKLAEFCWCKGIAILVAKKNQELILEKGYDVVLEQIQKTYNKQERKFFIEEFEKYVSFSKPQHH